MLRHSKSAMSMTSVCFGIAKVQCQKLNIIGYFFSFSYMPMHDMLKKYIYAKKIKEKRIKMLYIWLQMCIQGDVGVIGYTSNVIVPIKQLWLCVSSSDFLISQIVITFRYLCNLAMFSTHNMQNSLLLLIHVQVQCDLAITRNTCVDVCLLNCLNLFFEI